MFGKLIAGTLCLIGVHTCVWFSTNLQFVSEKAANNSLAICLALALPTSLLAYYGTQLTYEGLIPSDDLGLYQVSPGRAFVKGYDVETIS